MNDNGRALKWGHLVVVLVVQILALGFIYGSLKYQVESDSRRLDKLEEQTQGFKETKEEILRRLDRLENKLDLVIGRAAKR